MAAIINSRVDGNSSTNGTKVIAPRSNALDPRNAMLVQPFKRMVEEGFITELVVRFTPNGFTAEGVPDARVSGVEGSGLTAGVPAALGQILSAADKGNLVPKKTKGKTSGKAQVQPLPLKTLVSKDFDGTTDEQLMARMRVVASDSNGGTLIGRVRSAGRYLADVTLTYQEWWARANANDRALSLCQHKELVKLTDAQKNRLRNLPCPFRGTAEFLVSTESAPDAQSAAGDDDDEH